MRAWQLPLGFQTMVRRNCPENQVSANKKSEKSGNVLQITFESIRLNTLLAVEAIALHPKMQKDVPAGNC